jgi:hypothetical protein
MISIVIGSRNQGDDLLGEFNDGHGFSSEKNELRTAATSIKRSVATVYQCVLNQIICVMV